jgi:tetratricopeptide (TPR) repeat protein
MRTTKHFLVLAALGIALSGATACKKGGKGDKSTPPGVSPMAAALDPTKASAEAKQAFEEVANRYAAAKKSGPLTGARCEEMSNAFMGVYKKFGKQMTLAYFNAGAVWDECGNTEQAEKIYQAIVRDVPKYDLSYNNLGVIYWNRKQESKALDYFKKAVEANAATRAPRNNLAAALRNKYADSPNQGDFEKAEYELQSVLAVDSGNRLAYENLARLYYDRGRLKDKSYLLLADLVITQATRVLEQSNEKSADIFNLKGLLFMERDDQVNALRAFKAATEVEAKHADAHMNMAMISIRFRDYKQAEESLTIAIKDPRQKKNIETFIALGVAQRGLRKFKDAEASFKKASELQASDPRPLYNLGILYEEHIAPNAQEGKEFNKKPYLTAKDYYGKYASRASGNKELVASVDDAKRRVGQIDQLFKDIEEMKKLEAEAKRLEELQKKQEAEERNRLLDLEKKAREAAGKANAAEEEPPKADAKPAADKGAAKPAADKGAAKPAADKGAAKPAATKPK